MSRNRNKSKSNRPDGAKAFDIAFDMEDKLHEISKLFSVAILLVEAAESELVSDAFALIGSRGEDLLEEVKAMRTEICKLTGGYRDAPITLAGEDAA